VIRALKRLVSWLDSRFPEKVVVTAAEYARLDESIQNVLRMVNSAETAVLVQGERLAAVESNSVHKDAVKDLIAVVQTLKNDVDAMKNNLGWSRPAEKTAELQAMLNGEVI
jgi:hypothetical protein